MRAFAGSWLLSVVGLASLSQLPSTFSCIVILVVTLLLALRLRFLRATCIGFLVACLTMSLALHALARHQLLSDQVSTELDVTVLVGSVPERDGRRLSFLAKLESCHSCQSALSVERIKLAWYGRSPKLHAGERWRLRVKLKPPASLRNPGGFDAVAWFFVKGIHAKGYVSDGLSARKLSSSGGPSLSAIRQHIAEKIQHLSDQLTAAGLSSEQQQNYTGLVTALSVGLKSGIDDVHWDLLRSTGTAHLLAISGLHVGLVAAWVLLAGKAFSALLFTLAGRAAITKPMPDLRNPVMVCAIAAAMCYAMLAGLELPTQRAVLMLLVWMLAAIRCRFLPPLAALATALAVVLAVNVLNPLSVGFWLSFGTVFSLFYLHRGHVNQTQAHSDGKAYKLSGKIKSTARTHGLLGLVLLPVSAWFFQTGSLVSPLANLIAVPWVALIAVPLSLLTLMLSAFSDHLALYGLQLTLLSLHALMVFLGILHASQLSSMVMVVPGVVAFALCLTGLMIVLGPPGIRLRAFALPLLLPVLLFNSHTPKQDQFEVHFLDVGQGLAVLVFAGDQTLLFDTGGKISPQLSMFEAVVVPFLHASGRKQIDTLVVSHGDEDHAFGVQDIVFKYPDINVFTSQPLPALDGRQYSLCQSGVSWVTSSVHFAFLHPDARSVGSDNNQSCVLLAYSGRSRVLLTGDIEAKAEAHLVEKLNTSESFPVTVISAAHHGSNTSSTQKFLDRVRAKHVVFSAGTRNRYGFPHSEVQLRYKLAGSNTFITGRDGVVSFFLGPQGLLRPPATWWNSHRRFWHGIVNPDCWQKFAQQSLVLRLLALSQKGQILCGK